MKEKIKNGCLISLGLCAWLMISISNGMKTSPITDKLFIDIIKYPILLILSVLYIQWLLGYFISPLGGLGKEKRDMILNESKKNYKKFYRGTIGMGYFLIFMYVLGYFDRNVKPPMNFVNPAIFFIVLGVLARTKTIFQALCRIKIKEDSLCSTAFFWAGNQMLNRFYMSRKTRIPMLLGKRNRFATFYCRRVTPFSMA